MKGKADYYWRKSKEEGYPARSVFKLQEIQEKYKPLGPGNRVLDLGASPGSWSLYILDMLAGAGRVIGVDLNPPDEKLAAKKNYRFFHGDFTTEEVVRQIMAEGPFDVVVSDMRMGTACSRSFRAGRKRRSWTGSAGALPPRARSSPGQAGLNPWKPIFSVWASRGRAYRPAAALRCIFASPGALR